MPPSDQILVVPAKGATVRDPRTRQVVPPTGLRVPRHDPYWMALLRFGDVTEQAAPAAGAL